jgi:hypothetical protein
MVADVSWAELPHEGKHSLTADALLASPRGVTLCVNLLDDRLTALRRRVPRVWSDACQAARDGDERRCAMKIRQCIGIAELAGTPFDEGALLAGLQAVVDFARYWQEPDDEDRAFACAEACAALRPVAEAAAAAVDAVPGMHWWAEPVDGSRQRCTQFLDEQPQPEPQLTGTGERVQAWLADARDDEVSAHDRPEDPAAPYSGHWWSSPALSGLPVTTRRLPTLGAIGLGLIEDGHGLRLARCWPVAPQGGDRVYEIHGPEHWAGLVDRYPLDVSRSRRHDWWRVTEWTGRWLIPNYAAVAADWDAIHVSVAGYLTTAGVAVPTADGARTMLAGWDPDATWWLSDVLALASPPEVWRADDKAAFGWVQAQ